MRRFAVRTTAASLRPVHSAIASRFESVRAAVAAAAQAAGRAPAEVTLVAVTKTVAPDDVLEAYRAGARDFGENRVQELLAKQPLLPADARWHLIGPLQRNKARRVAPVVAIAHAIDDPAVARTLGQAARAAGRTIAILLEVNISREPAKHGVAPERAEAVAIELARADGVALAGLMAIPDPSAPARPAFRALAALRDVCARACGLPLPHLSMGMSADFAEAIAEGATLVRIGTAIFGSRTTPWRAPSEPPPASPLA